MNKIKNKVATNTTANANLIFCLMMMNKPTRNKANAKKLYQKHQQRDFYGIYPEISLRVF